MRIQHPERIQKDVGFLTVAKRKKAEIPKEQRFKRYWEIEREREASVVVPIYDSLPALGEYGELVYSNGLYIFLNQWVEIGGSGGGGIGGKVTIPSVGFLIQPSPEAVYATKGGGGDVYVVVTDSGRMKAVTFEATALPTEDATTTFALTAGAETNETHTLVLYVVSNQSSKTLRFSVITDDEKNVDVDVDASGVGLSVVDIKGNKTITLKRRYTAESGITFPCWSACGLILLVKEVK